MATIIVILIKLIAGMLVMLIHEVPKSIVSHYVMHPIYRASNKINRSFLKYIDPIGLIFFALANIGWQKPAHYNTSKYREKENGVLAVALTGYLSNLAVMVILVPIHINVDMPNYLTQFVFWMIYFNFGMVIINLLPVPPLEMTNLLYFFSPELCFKVIKNQRMIQIVFIFLLALGIIPMMVSALFSLLNITLLY